jgi:hypothetical protein
MRAAIVSMFLALAWLSAPPARAEVLDRVLAVVGPEVITLSDARAVLAFGLVPPVSGTDPTGQALAYLVNRQLMLTEVERYSAPAPDPAAIDRRVAEIRGRFPDAAAFQQALETTAMTEGRLRDFVTDNLRIDAYLEQRFAATAQPTDEEVQRYYHDHPGEFTVDGRLLPFDAVRAQAREKVAAERRAALVADWLDRLGRRVPVSNLYTAR